MSYPQTVYTTDWAPDTHDANAVLAFMLVPIAAFIAGCRLGMEVEIRDMLHRAQRECLREWYAATQRNRGQA
jgi:hypothetical protein